jgi:hypothetical protein
MTVIFYNTRHRGKCYKKFTSVIYEFLGAASLVRNTFSSKRF